MNRSLSFPLLTLILLSLSNVALAQPAFWQQMNGPYGGEMAAIAITPAGHIFALHYDGGVFRSTDNGEGWKRVDAEINIDNTYNIATNSLGHIFIASKVGGIMRSTDDGEHWSTVNAGPGNFNIQSLAITARGSLFLIAGSALYRSTNNGDQWSLLNTGSIQLTSSASHLRTDHQGNIILCLEHAFTGPFRSTDDGESWNDIGTGLINHGVRHIAFTRTGDMFIAQALDGMILVRSTDNGLHWTRLETGLSSMEVVADSNGRVFVMGRHKDGSGSMLRSTDNGDHWSPVNEGLEVLPFPTFNHPSSNERLIPSTALNAAGHLFITPLEGGVFRSTDGGEHWTETNSGMSATSIFSIAINSNGDLFAGARHGQVYRSTDNGSSWRRASNGIHVTSTSEEDAFLVFLALTPSDHLFAAIQDAGVFRSTDDGQNWTMVDTTFKRLESIKVDPAGTIFAGTNGEGVFRSTNNGEHWSKVSSGGLDAMRVMSIVSNESGEIVVGGSHDIGGAIYRTTDNGGSWDSISGGIAQFQIASLAIGRDGTIFAGAENDDAVGGGIFRTTDEGAHWTKVNTGLVDSMVLAMVIHPNGHIFAGINVDGTHAGSVLRSTDGGESWTQATAGITRIAVDDLYALTVSPSGFLFAGMEGCGVFRAFEQPSGVEPEKQAPSIALRSSPNPTATIARIEFSLPRSGRVRVVIFDVCGEEVTALVQARLSAGGHLVVWDATGMPEGEYFCRLQCEELYAIARIVVVH